MDFWTRLLGGLNLVAQFLPAFLQASMGFPVRIRKIRVKVGSTYEIKGAGQATASGEFDDDLIVSVR